MMGWRRIWALGALAATIAWAAVLADNYSTMTVTIKQTAKPFIYQYPGVFIAIGQRGSWYGQSVAGGLCKKEYIGGLMKAIRIASISVAALFVFTPWANAQQAITTVSEVPKLRAGAFSHPGTSADVLGIRAGMTVP